MQTERLNQYRDCQGAATTERRIHADRQIDNLACELYALLDERIRIVEEAISS